MERFPAGFIFLFTLLSRYCTCSKVCIFTSSIYRGLCTRSISCHLRANPLPLFALGIYFLSDPLAQLQPEQPGYNMYNWPEASQQRHYALSLSLALAPMATNYCSPAVALLPFDGKGQRGSGTWTSCLSDVTESIRKLWHIIPPQTYTWLQLQRGIFFFLITVSQLPNGIFIITSMISCHCQGNGGRRRSSRGECWQAPGEQFVSLVCQNMKVFFFSVM